MTSPRPQVSNATARRLFQLVEPIADVTYLAPEPTEAVMALGAGTIWDASFAPGPRSGPSAPQCGRCPCPPSRWRGSVTGPTCCASTGDGHVAALVSEGIGGTEAHVLHALAKGMPGEQFGRNGWKAIRLIGNDD